MPYVVSYTRPDGTSAQVEGDPFTTVGSAIMRVIWALAQESTQATTGDARRIGRALMDASPGVEMRHDASGLLFRLDPAPDKEI
jgi:hypothetical protein